VAFCEIDAGAVEIRSASCRFDAGAGALNTYGQNIVKSLTASGA
jgi:hypothetical protein